MKSEQESSETKKKRTGLFEVVTAHFAHSFFSSLSVWLERPYFVTHEYTTLLRTQIGKNVSIACEAQGKPSPLVSWIKKMDGKD